MHVILVWSLIHSRNPHMARVPYLTQADLTPENGDLLTRNINLYRALAHTPDGMRCRST